MQNCFFKYAKQVEITKKPKNNLSFISCKFHSVIFLVLLYIYCYLSIDPSVGSYLCFERDKKRYRGTKNDITGQKTISRDISFLCHRVIALIKAQVCDNAFYRSRYDIIFCPSFAALTRDKI